MAKKKINKNVEFLCPDCAGKGILEISNNFFEQCLNCNGTGWATDDDSFEPLYHYDDDWRG